MITKFKLFESGLEDWLNRPKDQDSDLYGSEEWIELQKDARKQTLLGKHIKYCYQFEDQRYGFELDDKTRIMFDESDNSIELDPNDGGLITQKARNQYDFESAYRWWKKHGGDEPIFPTKEEGKKFIDFCQKYLREKPKIKLKYLLTKDYKEKKVPIVSKEDIEKILLGKVVTISELDDFDIKTHHSTYKDVNWICSSVYYTPEEDKKWNYISLTFENKEKNDPYGFNFTYKLIYTNTFSEMGDRIKEEIELYYGNSINKEDKNLIGNYPQFKPIVKELQKIFKQ